MAWGALLGFIRLSTRPGILARPLSVEDGMRAVHYWLDHPRTQVLHPTPRHALLLGRLLTGAGAARNLSTDAHLAALAIEHGATLGSFDRDFERFAGLDFELLT
jgi:toxin-antitoxin system PIN domain toxin